MASHEEDESFLGTGITTKHIETFGRKVTTTANHLIGPLSETSNHAYQHALHDIHRELRRPRMQRSVFSFTQSSPSELVRAKLSTREIQHRALSYIPDEMLSGIPEDDNTYSLFQGYQAMLPEEESEHRKKHRRGDSRGWLLEDQKELKGAPGLEKARKDRDKATNRLEMLGIRKNMCSAEILEIDKKIANLHTMRKIVLDRLSSLEDEELKVEQDIFELEGHVEELQEQLEEQAEAAKLATPPTEASGSGPVEGDGPATPTASESFMSQSMYEKLPSPKAKRKGLNRRLSAPIRHGHFHPGTNVRNIPAHNDMITAVEFDGPFGTMVSAALDDTLRVWELNSGRCLGLLEGHRASVRCLHMEDNLVASGSIDASIRLWDLNRAEYPVTDSTFINKSELTEDDPEGLDSLAFEDAPESQESQEPPPSSSLADCHLFSLEAHVAEITAVHFHRDTLISGSADKTLRQWDLVKGRCVQTLDVLWAAAQASASANPGEKGKWRSSNRLPDASADFVGAVQCFDAALACGTADGMVRLWDLRSGQVHRSLVGHTGPVTCLQFDDVHMVTGSLDRSIRVSSPDPVQPTSS